MMLNRDNSVQEFRFDAILSEDHCCSNQKKRAQTTTKLDDPERRYAHEQMRLLENHVGGGGTRRRICRSLLDGDDEDLARPIKKLLRPCYEIKGAPVERGESSRISLKKILFSNSSSSSSKFILHKSSSNSLSPPGSSSDITTEYMAESSKSSCFDDACTLSLDPPAAAAERESGGSTSELRKNSNVDLNDHPDDEAKQQQQEPAAAEMTSFSDEGRKRLMLPSKEEGKGDSEVLAGGVTMRDRSEYRNSSGSVVQQDWLQLGLGPRITKPAVTTTTTTRPAAAAAAAQATNAENDEEELDASSSMLRLFPAKSEYGKLTASSTQWDASVDSSSSLYHQGVADTSTRFMREAAARPQQEDPGLTGFFRGMKQQQFAPGDTQLMISYSTMPHFGASAAAPELLQHRRTGLEMATQVPQFSEPASYAYGPSEGSAYFQSSAGHPGYDDRQQQQQQQQQQQLFGGRGLISNSSLTGGRSLLQQQQELHSSWKQEPGGFQQTFPPGNQGNRPSFYLPASSVQGPPPPPFTNISSSRVNQPEEWQALVKRLHLQSLYRGGAAAEHGTAQMDHELQQVATRAASSNLQDLQAQWNTAWSNRGGPYSQQEMIAASNKRGVPGIGLDSLGSRVGPPNPQIWQRSGLQLPYLPLQQQQQQQQQQQPQQQQPQHHSGAESSSKERHKASVTAKDHDLWFYLRAAAAGAGMASNQDCEQLPQILKGYLRVKDGTVPVSYVKKYLAHKLRLLCESEVEISCRGQILMPTMSLQHVRDVIWYSAATARGDEDVEAVAAGTTSSSSQQHSARDIVMELTYKRPKQQQQQHQSAQK